MPSIIDEGLSDAGHVTFPVKNGWSNRRQFDIEATVAKKEVLVEINEIFLKSLTEFRRTCRFDVVSTS